MRTKEEKGGGQEKGEDGKVLLILKKLRVAEDILFNDFSQKAPEVYLLERNWGPVQCNYSVFHTNMFIAALALGRDFQVIKASLVQSSMTGHWRAVHWVSFNIYGRNVLAHEKMSSK